MIVFFNSFLTMEKGASVSLMTFLNIPLSILSGVGVGVLIGFLLVLLFKYVHLRDSLKLSLIIGIAALLVFLESYLEKWFSFSSLLAVISLGMVILAKRPVAAKRISQKCEKLWTVAEIFLFVLVGVSIQIQYFSKYILMSLALLACSLLVRSLAVQLCLIKTKLNLKERIFVAISYLPKATVQAAIGGTLLDYGNSVSNDAIIAAGIIVLSVSVVSILFTAPLAAFSMDLTYTKLTTRTLEPVQS
jgi:NhaP-type Na+/H+ or K+/H+ antiporter